MTDIRPTYSYVCQRCDGRVEMKRRTGEHLTYEQHLKECWPNGTSGIDYIECALCKFAGCKITQHVKNIHGMSKEEYITLHGPVIASASSKKYGASGNYDWINRANARGDDLTEYKKKMSVSVSATVMSSPKERVRRSKLLGSLNKRADFRERSSKAAMITSARPEILERHTYNLRKWRTENFEEFYEKCVLKMNSAWQSKPERVLFELVKCVDDSFKRNQRLFDVSFTQKSKRKQIDMMNENSTLVEFDGIYHFKPIKGEEKFLAAKESDAQLDVVVLHRNLTLIRVSYDQFSYKQGGSFSESCLQQLFAILKDPQPGVFYIGACYKDLEGTNDVASS